MRCCLWEGLYRWQRSRCKPQLLRLLERTILTNRKRPSLEVDRPTRASQQIWTPLMIHMSMVQPSFPSLLAEQIAASVLARASSGRGNEDEAESEELSKWSLAVWLITLWRGIQGGELSEQVKGDLRRRIMVSLPAGDHL